MRALIGNRFGKILTEVIADVGAVSWILDGIGRTRVTLPVTGPKATETNLQIGNRVYLEMDHGLPAWGGVLDMPRVWSQKTVGTACYGIEQLFQTRCTEKNDAFYDRPAGVIFRELLL